MLVKDVSIINPKGNKRNLKFINYIDTSSVEDGVLVNVKNLENNFPSRAQRNLITQDILISSVRPNLRHNYFVKVDLENLIGSSGFIQVRANKKLIIPLYLYYFLTSNPRIRLYTSIANTSQTTFPAFSKDIVENLEIPKLSLKEQQHIVDTIGSIDDLIENNSLIIDKIALLNKNFVGKNSSYGTSKELKDICNISSGKGKKKLVEGKYKIIGANGEIGKTFDYNFNEEILVTGRVGTLGTFNRYNEKVWCSDNTLIIRSPFINYIHYYLLINFNIHNYNRGSTQPLITQTDLRKMEILIPKNINELENNLKENYKLIYQLEKNIKKYIRIKNLYLKKFFG